MTNLSNFGIFSNVVDDGHEHNFIESTKHKSQTCLKCGLTEKLSSFTIRFEFTTEGNGDTEDVKHFLAKDMNQALHYVEDYYLSIKLSDMDYNDGDGETYQSYSKFYYMQEDGDGQELTAEEYQENFGEIDDETPWINRIVNIYKDDE